MVPMGSSVTSPAPTQASHTNPISILRGIARYVREIRREGEEPPEVRGVVFEQYEDGRVQILKRQWEQQPDIPPGGQPDIPADAVRDNRVVIYTDGIQQGIWNQKDQIRRLLQAPRQHPDHGGSVDQPVIGIHEGKHLHARDAIKRIAMDWTYLKALQGRFVPEPWVHKKIFTADPVVKSVHHQIRQSLQAGRDVQLVAHSGGGAETALALTMLSREDGGRWKNVIKNHVRVLAMAPAVSKKDYELAGVKPENVFYTGSANDPLYHWASHYVTPALAMSNLPTLKAGIESLLMLRDRDPLPYHAPDYIFWRNVQPDGTQRIQTYLDGGPGGQFELP